MEKQMSNKRTNCTMTPAPKIMPRKITVKIVAEITCGNSHNFFQIIDPPHWQYIVFLYFNSNMKSIPQKWLNLCINQVKQKCNGIITGKAV